MLKYLETLAQEVACIMYVTAISNEDM